ncbi:hypothetical protein K439DRAFT_1625473 [Ramaria rubella]|nr:hypothetical protein K439DRAFT_1625473 [Ramaria rubella]
MYHDRSWREHVVEFRQLARAYSSLLVATFVLLLPALDSAVSQWIVATQHPFHPVQLATRASSCSPDAPHPLIQRRVRPPHIRFEASKSSLPSTPSRLYQAVVILFMSDVRENHDRNGYGLCYVIRSIGPRMFLGMFPVYPTPTSPRTQSGHTTITPSPISTVWMPRDDTKSTDPTSVVAPALTSPSIESNANASSPKISAITASYQQTSWHDDFPINATVALNSTLDPSTRCPTSTLRSFCTHEGDPAAVLEHLTSPVKLAYRRSKILHDKFQHASHAKPRTMAYSGAMDTLGRTALLVPRGGTACRRPEIQTTGAIHRRDCYAKATHGVLVTRGLSGRHSVSHGVVDDLTTKGGLACRRPKIPENASKTWIYGGGRKARRRYQLPHINGSIAAPREARTHFSEECSPRRRGRNPGRKEKTNRPFLGIIAVGIIVRGKNFTYVDKRWIPGFGARTDVHTHLEKIRGAHYEFQVDGAERKNLERTCKKFKFTTVQVRSENEISQKNGSETEPWAANGVER